MNDLNKQEYFQIPEDVFDRDAPFDEFKQDVSIVTVVVEEETEFSGVLVLHPNYIIGMKGMKSIPFEPSQIVRVYQTEEDQKMRTDQSWTIWNHPWNTNTERQIQTQ